MCQLIITQEIIEQYKSEFLQEIELGLEATFAEEEVVPDNIRMVKSWVNEICTNLMKWYSGSDEQSVYHITT